MRTLIALTVLVGFVMLPETCAVDGTAVNGRAVSVQWRYGLINWTGACCECYDPRWMGSINLFTIQNGRVSRTDTIYHRTQGCAEYPAFNIEATRVAFYRTTRAPLPTENPPTASCAPGTPQGKVSVIDIDGNNLTDLCDMQAGIPNEGGLDWPAGDWIYYVQTEDGKVGGGPENNEIWRVNVRTRENHKVFAIAGGSGDMSCTFFRRFQLSAAGDRMGIQVMPMYTCANSFDANGIADFPPSGGTLGSSNYSHFCGCNAVVSAGGDLGAHWCGGHNDLFIAGANTSVTLSQIAQWSGDGDKFGRDAELVRWATNSDKWVLQSVGWYGHAGDMLKGSNQVAGNWVDKAGICISTNPKVPLDEAQTGMIKYGNCAGDMWIDGGPENAGKYEDRNGQWHSIPGYDPTSSEYLPVSSMTRPGPSVLRESGGITLRMSLPGTVEISDLRGRICRRADGASVVRLSLPAGMYAVEVRRERVQTSKFLISR